MALADAGAYEAGARSPAGTITGRVVDYVDGTGVQGVCVVAFGDRGTVRAGVVTSAGYYRIERLQPDTYRLLWRPCFGHTASMWEGGTFFANATGQPVAAGATVKVDIQAFTPAFISLPAGDRSEEGFADHPGLCFEAISTTRNESFVEFFDLDAVRKRPTGSAGGQLPRVLLGLSARRGPLRLPRGVSFHEAAILWTQDAQSDNGYTLPFRLGAAISGKVTDPSGLPQKRVAVTVTAQRLRTRDRQHRGRGPLLPEWRGRWLPFPEAPLRRTRGGVPGPVVRQQDVAGDCRHLHGG